MRVFRNDPIGTVIAYVVPVEADLEWAEINSLEYDWLAGDTYPPPTNIVLKFLELDG